MNTEENQRTINILYGYHPERIDERVLLTMLNQSTYQIKPVIQKQDIIHAIQHEKIDIAMISNHIQNEDPYEICDQITKKHAIPVFMFVSTPECVDILKAFTKGVSDIIISPYIKPLVFARIETYYRLNYLEKLFKKKTSPNILNKECDPEPKKGAVHYKFEKTKILLVEDNEVNQQLMNNILTQSGIQVDIAHNGQDAVDKIKKALDNKKLLYDLILMDLQMPVLDGFSASRNIRKLVENNQMPEIPIIAITAHTSVHSREKCLRAGMVDFMPKPIYPETCLEVLSQWIHSDKISYAKTSHIPLQQKSSSEIRSQIPEINIKIGIKRAAGNEVLFKKMLLEFLNEYQDIVQQLDTIFRNKNFDELKVVAHTLKGLGGNIGAENLHKNAFLLEQAIKLGIKPDINTAFTNLVQTLERLIQGIKQNMEWLKQTESQDVLLPNSVTNLKKLKESLQNLGELLESGRTTAIDSFQKLESLIPDTMQTESKHLESLILAYDFDNAQIYLRTILNKLSSK